MRIRPFVVAALLAAAALAPAALALQDPAPAPKPAAPAADDAKARKDAKVKRMFELSRWEEQVLKGMDAAFEQQENMGVLPKSFAKKFRKAADMDALKAIAMEIFSELYDEPTLDGLIAFLETDAGKKYAEANLKIMAVVQEKITPWAMETAQKVMADTLANPDEEEESSVGGGVKEAKRSANETAAIATLRNLASAQAMMQGTGKIDCDGDGIGEFGTFLEMTGTVGVRKSLKGGTTPAADFTSHGTVLSPPVLSKSLASVGPDGVVKKSGYCFRIFLPDSATPSGFVGETGPADLAAFGGGSRMVCVDLSETTWCAYAWPETRGESGNRAFFINQAGDVLQSTNEVAKWSGEKAPPGNAAFKGAGITGVIAVGTTGRDGDVWKVTN
jgi:hypothetical protein